MRSAEIDRYVSETKGLECGVPTTSKMLKASRATRVFSLLLISPSHHVAHREGQGPPDEQGKLGTA